MGVPWGILLVGALMVALSIPLILRRVPRNSVYGLRTKRTMNGTDEDWYDLNQRYGYALCVAGCATILGYLALSLFNLSKAAGGFAGAGMVICALLVTHYFAVKKRH